MVSLIFYFIDNNRVMNHYQKPIFALRLGKEQDDGTGTYLGLFYAFHIKGEFSNKTITNGVTEATSYFLFIKGKEMKDQNHLFQIPENANWNIIDGNVRSNDEQNYYYQTDLFRAKNYQTDCSGDSAPIVNSMDDVTEEFVSDYLKIFLKTLEPEKSYTSFSKEIKDITLTFSALKNQCTKEDVVKQYALSYFKEPDYNLTPGTYGNDDLGFINVGKYYDAYFSDLVGRCILGNIFVMDKIEKKDNQVIAYYNYGIDFIPEFELQAHYQVFMTLENQMLHIEKVEYIPLES